MRSAVGTGRARRVGAWLPLLTGAVVLGLGAAPARSAADELVAFGGAVDSFAMGAGGKASLALPLAAEAFQTRTRVEVNSQPRVQAYAGVVDVPLAELAGVVAPPTAGVAQPQYCYANFPGEPACQAGPPPNPSGTNVGSGRAEATGDFADPKKTGGSSSVAATFSESPASTAGYSWSRSAIAIVDEVVVATTTTKTGQLDIGGAVVIDSIEASVTTRTGGTPGTAAAEASLVIQGAEIGGVPVRFTPDGVEVADEGQDLPENPMAAVLAALAEAGLTVHPLVAPTMTAADDGTSAAATIDGLVFSVEDPATGNTAVYRFGSARATSSAVRQGGGGDVITSVLGGGEPSAPAASGSGGASGGGGSAGGGGFAPPAAGAGAAPAEPAGAAGEAFAPAGSIEVSPEVRSISRRFRNVYGGGLVGVLLVAGAAAAGVFRDRSLLSYLRRR